MRFKFLVCLLWLISQQCLAVAKIESWQTSQGSRVYYVQTQQLPMVDIRVTFAAGSAHDGNQQGIAALTSAMLGTGAGHWNADQIADRFESVGAMFGSDVSEDMASLSLRSLTEPALLNKAVETFKTVLINPSFKEADFQREKNRTLAALKHREESPDALAGLAFSHALYGNHPYAHPEAGYIETVKPLNREALKRFYQRYYVAANGIVIIVGNLDRPQAEQLAEQLLAGLPQGEKAPEIPPVTLPAQAFSQHIEFPSTQTHVMAGLPATYRKDPDYFPLYVGNHILGGGGLVSLLFEEVREKRGLAYTASSQMAPLYRSGPFVMGLQTRNDQTAEATRLMIDTLTHFVEQGPTAEQLIAAKKNITGGFAMRIDTNAKLADYATMIGFYQQPLNYLDTFQANVEAVGIDDIKSAFARRIRPELLQTISVGSSQKPNGQ